MSPTERAQLLKATQAASEAAQRLYRELANAATLLRSGTLNAHREAFLFSAVDNEEAALTHAMSVLWELRRSSKGANAT